MPCARERALQDGAVSGLVGLAVLRAEREAGIVFVDSQTAFEQAIAAGRLSAVPTSPVYAGDFMYMGTRLGRHTFKNINTREYLP